MPCMKGVYKDKKAPVHWSAARNKERVVEHKSCPTGKISQQQKPESTLTGSECKCAGRRRVHAAEACRMRAARCAGLRAGRRAGCAPEDARVARLKTCRLHAARRAGCTPQDVPVARRKTCQLHAARRAGGAPCARRVRAVCALQRGRPSGPAFLFSLGSPRAPRSGRRREAARPAWPPGAQGVPRSPKGT